MDTSLVGTQRLTAHVAAWDNGRTPDDGPPDRIIETDVWMEADGTIIEDTERIAAIRRIQTQQGAGNGKG